MQVELDSAEVLMLLGMVSGAIMSTPSSATRNMLCDIQIKLLHESKKEEDRRNASRA